MSLRQLITVMFIIKYSVGSLEGGPSALIPNSPSSKGNEFVLAFWSSGGQANIPSPTIALFVTTDDPDPVSFTVEAPNAPTLFSPRNGTAVASQTTTITLPASNASPAVISQDIRVFHQSQRDKGIRVIAEDGKKISVYGIVEDDVSADAFLALPCVEYSENAPDRYIYYVFSADIEGTTEHFSSRFMIIPCEDDTEVNLIPSQTLEISADISSVGFQTQVGPDLSTTTFRISLDSLQTAMFQSPNDLTGTMLESNKPITVIVGHECGQVPSGITACDVLIEQVPPHITYGTRFLTAPLQFRESGERYRIGSVGNSPNEVTVTCTSEGGTPETRLTQTLTRGEYAEFDTSGNSDRGFTESYRREFCCIESSLPATVMQYTKGHSVDEISDRGDPSMLYIPPVTQYLNDFTLTTDLQVRTSFQGFMSYTVASQFFTDPLVDGRKVLINGTTYIPDSGYSPIYCSDTSTVSGYGAYSVLPQGDNAIMYNQPGAGFYPFIYGLDIEISFEYPSGFELKPEGLPVIEIPDLTVPENIGTIEFPIRRVGGDLEIPSFIVISSRDTGTGIGHATAGSDYEAIQPTSNKLPGHRLRYRANNQDPRSVDTLRITIIDDDDEESREVFEVYVIEVRRNAFISKSVGTITILDDESGIVGFDPSVYDVPERQGFVDLVVRTNNDIILQNGSVLFLTEDGSAVSSGDDADYIATSQTNAISVTFPDDDDPFTTVIRVPINDDDIVESIENFFGRLVLDPNVTLNGLIITEPDAIVNIIDDDVFFLGFEHTSYSVSECAQLATVCLIVFSGQLSTEIVIKITTQNGSALSPDDFTATLQLLTFGPGVTSLCVDVPIIDDENFETSEYFICLADLSNPTDISFVEISPVETRVDIIVNDLPIIEIPDLTVAESIELVKIPIRRIGGDLSLQSVIVVSSREAEFQSATVTSDFEAVQPSHRLEFEAGKVDPRNEDTLSVRIIDDDEIEPDETFEIYLVEVMRNATLVKMFGNVTIVDDDSAPEVFFNAIVYNQQENNHYVEVVIRTNSERLRNGGVLFFTEDGTANSTGDDPDYQSIPRVNATSVIFPIGYDPFTTIVRIFVFDDDIVEETEYFFCRLVPDPNIPIQGLMMNESLSMIQVNIHSDEDFVSVGFDPTNYTLSEVRDESLSLIVKVLDGRLSRDVVVHYMLSDSTLFDGDSQNNTLTFSPDLLTKSVKVFVSKDIPEEEFGKSFQAQLSTQSNHVIITQSVATIEVFSNKSSCSVDQDVFFVVDTSLSSNEFLFCHEMYATELLTETLSACSGDSNTQIGSYLYPSDEMSLESDMRLFRLGDESCYGSVESFHELVRASGLDQNNSISDGGFRPAIRLPHRVLNLVADDIEDEIMNTNASANRCRTVIILTNGPSDSNQDNLTTAVQRLLTSNVTIVTATLGNPPAFNGAIAISAPSVEELIAQLVNLLVKNSVIGSTQATDVIRRFNENNEAYCDCNLDNNCRSVCSIPELCKIPPTGQCFVKCFTDENCAGGNTLSMTRKECCVDFEDGRSFQIDGEDTCFSCVVFGFFQASFTAIESQEAYTVPVGFTKSRSELSQQFNILRYFDTASSSDFAIRDSVFQISSQTDNQEISFTFRADNLALEIDERLQLRLYPASQLNQFDFSRNAFFLDTLDMVILDSDVSEIGFDDIVFESRELEPIRITLILTKNLAAPVTIRLLPKTLQEHRRSGRPDPRDTYPNAGRRLQLPAPTEANFADFDNSVIVSRILTSPTTITVPIIDDVIAESHEQDFVVTLDIVEAKLMSRITVPQPDVICRIVDDDEIHIGFKEATYTFSESDAIAGHLNHVFLVKEFGALAEQTFQVVVEVDIHATLLISDFQPATPLGHGDDPDFSIGEGAQQNHTLDFSPNQQKLSFSVHIFDDVLAEGTEAFQLSIVIPKQGRQEFSSPVLLSQNALIVIEDNDRVVFGFEKANYAVNESDTTFEICGEVKSLGREVTILTEIDMGVNTIPNTADDQDYVRITSDGGIQLQINNQTRRSCFFLNIIADEVVENAETFEIQLIFLSMSPILEMFLFQLDPSTATLTISGDADVTIGFADLPFEVNENDGSVSINVGVLDGVLTGPVDVSLSVSASTAQMDCSGVQDIYFLVDATESNSNLQFCQEMYVLQLISAQLNPRVGNDLSGTRIGTYLYPKAFSSRRESITYFQPGDFDCRETVFNFHQLMQAFTLDSFDLLQIDETLHELQRNSLRGSITLPTKALNILAKKIKANVVLHGDRRRIVIILTDGLSDESDDEIIDAVNDIVEVGGSNLTLIAGGIASVFIHDTEKFEQHVKLLANGIDQNSFVIHSTFGSQALIGNNLVDILENNGAICEKQADIIRNGLKEEFYCECNVQDFSPQNDVCQSSCPSHIFESGIENCKAPSTSLCDSSKEEESQGSDYVTDVITRDLSFGPSRTNHTVSVTILNDEIFELTEHFTVSLSLLLSPEDRVAVDPDTANVTILDDDFLEFQFGLNSYSVDESETSVNVVLSTTVTSDDGGVFVVRATISTRDETAIGTPDSEADYISVNNRRISFTRNGQDNSLRTVFEIRINTDNLTENNETFSVQVIEIKLATDRHADDIDLSNQEKNRLQSGETIVSIIDDDDITIGFLDLENSFTVREGQNVTIKFNIGVIPDFRKLRLEVFVTLQILDSDATVESSDISPSSINLTFKRDMENQSVNVTIVDDMEIEEVERFLLLLLDLPTGSPQSYIEPSEGNNFLEVTILDDDAVVGFNDNLTVLVNESTGVVEIEIVVFDGELLREIEVEFSTEDGSARSQITESDGGGDFTKYETLLTFNQCSSMIATRVPVTIRDDNRLENMEEFSVSLRHKVGSDAVRNVRLEPSSITLQIIDEDNATIGFVQSSYTIQEGMNGACIGVEVKSGDIQMDVMIQFTTIDGSAMKGINYKVDSETSLNFNGESESSTPQCVKVSAARAQMQNDKNEKTFTARLTFNSTRVILDPDTAMIVINSIDRTDIVPRIRDDKSVKPNHLLEYDIGMNNSFCLENATAELNFTIYCNSNTQSDTKHISTEWFFSRENMDEVTILDNNTDILRFENETTNSSLIFGPAAFLELLQFSNSENTSVIIGCRLTNAFGENDTKLIEISQCAPNVCQDGVTNSCNQNCFRNENIYTCSCNRGYVLNESDSETCRVANCGSLADPVNGQVEYSETTYNSIANYSCDSMHILDPYEQNLRICLRNESWSGTAPTCRLCRGGVAADGISCLEYDVCTKHNCTGSAKCQPSGNESFTCTCSSVVYQLHPDGVSCQVHTGVIVGAVVAGLILLIIAVVLAAAGIRKYNRKLKEIAWKEHDAKDVGNLYGKNGAFKSSDDHGAGLTKFTVQSSFDALKEIQKELLIYSANLRILDTIGQGEFGVVYKGHLLKNLGQTVTGVVAIKTLKGFVDETLVEGLLNECVKMQKFNHPNVLNLTGVCLDGGPSPFLVMPFMANGSLHSYLKKERNNLVISTESDSIENLEKMTVILKQLLDMCHQVAKGMEYIASMRFVHRDLATRNCMIDVNYVIKVADFGLSEQMESKNYFRQDRAGAMKLPFKWLALESLTDSIFSEKTDVWAFGVTCWEIFSGGKAPYSSINPAELSQKLENGYRLEKPANEACSDQVYSVMMECWNADPDERPSFSELVEIISLYLESMAGYLHIGAFNTPTTDSEIVPGRDLEACDTSSHAEATDDACQCENNLEPKVTVCVPQASVTETAI